MLKSKKFIYGNSIRWQRERKGLLFAVNKPDIEVATPPEFKGHVGIWSPEDLFIASVNSCIMTTFLYYAEKQGLEFVSYESRAEGVLELIEGRLTFSEIKVKPLVFVKRNSDIQKVKAILEASEKNCLVSNSIKCEVKVLPEIKIEP